MKWNREFEIKYAVSIFIHAASSRLVWEDAEGSEEEAAAAWSSCQRGGTCGCCSCCDCGGGLVVLVEVEVAVEEGPRGSGGAGSGGVLGGGNTWKPPDRVKMDQIRSSRRHPAPTNQIEVKKETNYCHHHRREMEERHGKNEPNGNGISAVTFASFLALDRPIHLSQFKVFAFFPNHVSE